MTRKGEWKKTFVIWGYFVSLNWAKTMWVNNYKSGNLGLRDDFFSSYLAHMPGI